MASSTYRTIKNTAVKIIHSSIVILYIVYLIEIRNVGDAVPYEMRINIDIICGKITLPPLAWSPFPVTSDRDG